MSGQIRCKHTPVLVDDAAAVGVVAAAGLTAGLVTGAAATGGSSTVCSIMSGATITASTKQHLVLVFKLSKVDFFIVEVCVIIVVQLGQLCQFSQINLSGS